MTNERFYSMFPHAAWPDELSNASWQAALDQMTKIEAATVERCAEIASRQYLAATCLEQQEKIVAAIRALSNQEQFDAAAKKIDDVQRKQP